MGGKLLGYITKNFLKEFSVLKPKPDFCSSFQAKPKSKRVKEVICGKELACVKKFYSKIFCQHQKMSKVTLPFLLKMAE